MLILQVLKEIAIIQELLGEFGISPGVVKTINGQTTWGEVLALLDNDEAQFTSLITEAENRLEMDITDEAVATNRTLEELRPLAV